MRLVCLVAQVVLLPPVQALVALVAKSLSPQVPQVQHLRLPQPVPLVPSASTSAGRLRVTAQTLAQQPETYYSFTKQGATAVRRPQVPQPVTSRSLQPMAA